MSASETSTLAAHSSSRNGAARARRLALVALVLATLGVYARTATHGFVAYDDPAYVSENPAVERGISLEGLRWACGFHAGNWHPLTWLAHMLDWELFGAYAGAHHLVSAALHALNAVLLYLFLARATRAGWTSLVVAASFALHPLRVESVAWASERKDVLAGTFWMLTLLAYERYARRGGPGRYALVSLGLALGLMAKSMLVTLPVVLLLLDEWPLGRARSRAGSAAGPAPTPLPSLAPTHPGDMPGSTIGARSGCALLLEKVPWILLALAAGAATLFIQRSEGAAGTLSSLRLVDRAANPFLSYGVYIAKTLWPSALACFVPHPVLVTPREELASALHRPALLTAAALVALTVLVLRQRRERPYLLVGWSWYLVTALPVIGFVQVGQQAYADRYTYLPTIGLGIMLAFLGRELLVRRPHLVPWAAGFVALVLCALALLSARQVGVWRDSRTLFTHAARVTDRNYLAHTFLGAAARRAGRLDEARAEFERALEDNKLHVQAMLELGLTLQELGDLPGARRALNRTLRNDPRNEQALRALAEVERALAVPQGGINRGGAENAEQRGE